MVQDLAQRAGLPKLKVYLINEAQRNALAIGRSREHAAVVATIGILQVLSAREMRSVMAHELANVRHRDIQIPTISPTMAGAMWALASLALFFGGRCADGCPANPLAGIAVAPLARYRPP
jgi:heat shock protein HtpX